MKPIGCSNFGLIYCSNIFYRSLNELGEYEADFESSMEDPWLDDRGSLGFSSWMPNRADRTNPRTGECKFHEPVD